MRKNIDMALLVIRLMLATILLAHGIPKILDYGGAVEFFTSMGVPAPSVTVLFSMTAEVVSGIAMLLGVFVEAAAILVMLDMVGAMATVHLKYGFDFAQGGVEHPLSVFAMALAILLAGAGAYAVRRKTPVVP
jgi:putative oxidoreductase